MRKISISPLMADALVADYKARKGTQKALAAHYGVSIRTLNRILIEKGLSTPVPRLQGEAYMVMAILKKLKVAPIDLESILCLQMNNTKEFVEEYLSKRPISELARILYNSVANKTLSA